MLPIKDVMTKDVHSIDKSAHICDALKQLTRYGISGMPVVEPDMTVIGILSEKDVLHLLIDPWDSKRSQVQDFMSRKVFTFHEDDCVFEVCRVFLKHTIRRVPIVRDERLVGIVSRHDIVSLIIKAEETLSDLRVA
jgi:CBS domain-containing protein